MTRRGHGLGDWLLQRLTAVYLGCYSVYLMVNFSLWPVHGYEQWHAWIGRPLVAISCAGFVLAILVHGWVGMRDIVFDYIHTVRLRLGVLFLIGMLLAGCGFWALRILVLATE